MYVTKFHANGALQWQFESHGTLEGVSYCAKGLGTDNKQHIHVTGTTISLDRTDTDVFMLELSPSGDIVDQKTLGTPFDDVALSIQVTFKQEIYLGGYSGGSMTLGQASPQNPCNESTLATCESGFVIKLDSESQVRWTRTLSSGIADRVVDLTVDVDSGAIVVIGETRGSLQRAEPSVLHAGDVFLMRLDSTTGESQWVTQLGAKDPSVPDVCEVRSVRRSESAHPRGHCRVAVRQDEVFLSATTFGLMTTLPAQIQEYARVCEDPVRRRKLIDGVCMQLFAARMSLQNGEVRWIQQIVDRTHTSADAVVVTGTQGSEVVALGLADAGLLSAEYMEQLLVVRFSADGELQWMHEDGFDGEDHAVGMLGTSLSEELLVLGYGSRVKQRSSVNLNTYVRKFNANSGDRVAICQDRIAFVENATRIQQQSTSRVLVRLSVQRDQQHLCVGTSTTATYRAIPSNTMDANAMAVATRDYVPITGLLQFPTDALTSVVAVEILPKDSSFLGTERSASVVQFSVTLEASSADIKVTSPTTTTIYIDLVPVDATVVDTAAANGALWRQLSHIALYGVVGVLLLVLVLGRCVCWRRCLRRAKAFQYKTIQLQRRRSLVKEDAATLMRKRGLTPVGSPRRRTPSPENEVPINDDDDEAETEELRTHLEEIQQLNHALESLLSAHQAAGTSPTRASRSRAQSSAK
ncbi:hypothetical protein Poli38472_012221 [Pythium oligandrum]|uniref:Uncharacterized protein n=1 Tax=Pythium oligandrum TaxID=41045 RepID=A0A8K1CPH1_PYTOL|nr:hypothetical protein Poli38472_012221 [Pythium oligandrum]|eukprot:TMW67105.1 hypothetical protein Poli38472_012221 [Pythium oligandrum]